MARRKQRFGYSARYAGVLTGKHYLGADTGLVDKNGTIIRAGDEIEFDGKIGRVFLNVLDNAYGFYPDDYKLQESGMSAEDYLRDYPMVDGDWATTERKREYFDF